MRNFLFNILLIILVISCNSKNEPAASASAKKSETKDSLKYAYTATHSSDVTVPSPPEYAGMVLKIWKMFESNKIDSMRQYYADTVTYEPSNGHRFRGSKNDLLNYATKDISGLDSLRFDISTWQTVHLND